MSVLSDCARLRDIIRDLAVRRYFSPSLFVARWSTQTSLESDFEQLVNKFISEGKIHSSTTFVLDSETKTLETKLTDALNGLSIDLSCSQVQFLSVKGLFRLFDEPFNEFLESVLPRCAGTEDFDWNLLGHIIQATIELLNTVQTQSKALLKLEGDLTPLDDIFVDDVDDYDTLNDAVLAWLQQSRIDKSEDIRAELGSHQWLGRDFPTRWLIDRLRDHTILQVERLLTPNGEQTSSEHHRVVLITDALSALTVFNSSMEQQQLKLREVFSKGSYRSPKRRSSVSSAMESISAKRRRVSISDPGSPPGTIGTSISVSASTTPSPPTNGSHNMNGRATLSPSVSTASLAEEKKPVVTAAMLRALTRNVKAQYGQW